MSPRSNLYRARGTELRGGDLVLKDESMPEFAWLLSTLVILDGRVVVDKTGLDGHYDFELKFALSQEPMPLRSSPQRANNAGSGLTFGKFRSRY
jgi:uncharacterized protein (TIGR03435 family)